MRLEGYANMAAIKQLLARLPTLWQDELKRYYYRRQIGAGTFVTDEPEFALLHELVKPGDWVLDVGANVGHYTKRFSEIVGPAGRVVSFEPVPATFAILAGNVRLLPTQNVTLVNAAASSHTAPVSMAIPQFESGMNNYYQAHITPQADPGSVAASVLALRIDALQLDGPVRLVKIDAEGHEGEVLRGMIELLRAKRPHLIVEGSSEAIASYLAELDYRPIVLGNSPNTLFQVPLG